MYGRMQGAVKRMGHVAIIAFFQRPIGGATKTPNATIYSDMASLLLVKEFSGIKIIFKIFSHLYFH